MFGGDCVHIDVESISGGHFVDLETAYDVTYGTSRSPQRVLVVCGLNDVMHGASLEEFKDRVYSLFDAVERNNRFHPRVRNKFILCPLLMVPQYTWFADNTIARPPKHVDKTSLFVDINNCSMEGMGIVPLVWTDSV